MKTLQFTSQKMGDISQRRTQKLKNNHVKKICSYDNSYFFTL